MTQLPWELIPKEMKSACESIPDTLTFTAAQSMIAMLGNQSTLLSSGN